MQGTHQSAFTLIELLVVLVMLGVLAALAIPQFSDRTQDARLGSLQSNLATVRNSLEFYRTNHRNKYPGYPAAGGAPASAIVVDQLTLASKSDGSTAPISTAGYEYGPYLRDGIPDNPINGLSTIKVVADGQPFPTPDDTTGWTYQPQTGRFRANSTGASPAGRNYADY
jgi:general secretion pathway protein G